MKPTWKASPEALKKAKQDLEDADKKRKEAKSKEQDYDGPGYHIYDIFGNDDK